MTANDIHPTALVAPGAVLGTGNVIGPFVSVGASVVLGDDNWIGAGAVMGAPPEVRGAELEPFGEAPERDRGGLVVGDRTVIREQVVIGRGWASSTVIGDDCYVMAGSYVAHDCVVGARCTLSSGVRLAGHVRIGPFATLGLGAVVHQRRTVGAAAMVGMGAVVSRDVAALTKVYGTPARMHGLNDGVMALLGVEPERAGQLADLLAQIDEPAALVQLAEWAPALASALVSWPEASA